MLHEITVFVLTYNEQVNIARVLAPLRDFARVIVLDSGSSDATQALVQQFGFAEWHQRSFDNHANQCNHVLDQLAVSTPWVMSLDADYVLTAELITELTQLKPAAQMHGFSCEFSFCIDGKLLRGSLYPPRTVLFRHGMARFYQSGHTQRLRIEGSVATLQGKILHDDRKDWAFFCRNQSKYGRLEAQHLYESAFSALPLTAKVRKLGVIAPWLVPLMCLFWTGLIFEGKAGWQYTHMRWVGESAIAKHLWRLRLGKNRS
jgi:glycosyltransferase involved in cell wall biosynthesis